MRDENKKHNGRHGQSLPNRLSLFLPIDRMNHDLSKPASVPYSWFSGVCVPLF